MKLYCKIKQGGKWKWYRGDSSWKIHVARELCECRVCLKTKPNVVSQEDCPCNVDVFGNRINCKDCSEEEE